MGMEVKKKKTSNVSLSNKIQKRKYQVKDDENSQKKDKREENEIRDAAFSKSLFQNSLTFNYNSALGNLSASAVSKFHKTVIINQLKRFKIHEILSPFQRRVTSIAWHPKYPQISVAASKGGDLTLHNLNGTDDCFCPGVGAGGSVLWVKCSNKDPYTVYTASMTGDIFEQDLHGKTSKALFSLPPSWDNWFTSLDVCYNRGLLLSGDCFGNSYLLTMSGEPVWKPKKLHRSKVTHCEFNKHDPNIFVTASLDHSVKLWDLRSISESKESLMHFPHFCAVNSAYFSPSNGLNLLTTDQHSQLRVYSSPCWNETLFITHPHRQFQHMTPIKATWHPMEDIIIVGRYPDNNIQPDDVRTIDFYDGLSGKLLHSTLSPSGNIVSLNAMNSTGDTLLAAAGHSIMYLKDENVLYKEVSSYKSDDDSEQTSNLIPFGKKAKSLTKRAKKISSKKTKTNIY